MYKNLLVPTDGSALSRRTIRDAAKLAAKLGAKITGFYVAPSYHIEVYTDYVPPDLITPEQHKASAKKTAQRYLEVVRKAADCDFPWSLLPDERGSEDRCVLANQRGGTKPQGITFAQLQIEKALPTIGWLLEKNSGADKWLKKQYTFPRSRG